MNLQEKITTEILNKALSAMSEKDILDMTKKIMPKVMQEHIEGAMQDFIENEVDVYVLFEKAGLKKKITDIIVNAIKGI